MSSPTQDLQQPQIIACSSEDSGSSSKTRPDMVGRLNPRWSRDGRIAPGQRFGSWEVLSSAPFQRSSALYVRCRCACGIEKDVNLRFMETGRSTQCKACASKQTHTKQGHTLVASEVDKVLQKRVAAMAQRCSNPNDQSWKNYGQRGVRFLFRSVADAVSWIKVHLPHETYKGLDIDRIHNDGDYAPGNLRLATRKKNLTNRRNTVRVLWQGQSILLPEWKENPYSTSCAGRYISAGMSGEQILQRAWQAVAEKRKGWRALQAKLESTTSSIADQTTGSSPAD